jgi:hypothetical protein
MQIAESIYNRKHLISTAIRLKKVLSKNKKSKVITPPSDLNDHKSSYFNKLRRKVFNHFILFRRSVMAFINDN